VRNSIWFDTTRFEAQNEKMALLATPMNRSRFRYNYSIEHTELQQL